MGSFQNIETEGHNSNFEADFILGYTEDAQLISLYRCTETYSNINSELGFLSSSFHVNFAFAGFHFNSKEQLKFNTFSANYHL